jgi:hypothetical protein
MSTRLAPLPNLVHIRLLAVPFSAVFRVYMHINLFASLRLPIRPFVLCS